MREYGNSFLFVAFLGFVNMFSIVLFAGTNNGLNIIIPLLCSLMMVAVSMNRFNKIFELENKRWMDTQKKAKKQYYEQIANFISNRKKKMYDEYYARLKNIKEEKRQVRAEKGF